MRAKLQDEINIHQNNVKRRIDGFYAEFEQKNKDVKKSLYQNEDDIRMCAPNMDLKRAQEQINNLKNQFEDENALM